MKAYKADEPKLVINIAGKGYVATKGKVFRYVSLWSAAETWDTGISPQTGAAVTIPKGQHLLFDIDSSPKLTYITVEGSLIFAPHPSDTNH